MTRIVKKKEKKKLSYKNRAVPFSSTALSRGSSLLFVMNGSKLKAVTGKVTLLVICTEPRLFTDSTCFAGDDILFFGQEN